MAERDRDAGARPGADEGFLQRWSRRKAEARGADQTATADPGAAAEARPAASEPTPEAAQGEPAPVAAEELPDIDSLDASSDFSVFMRPGVPEYLRKEALRKLWRSDPSFAKIDGLLEYGEDYTLPSWPKGIIRTAYQIGRGFATELEKLEGADPPPAEAAEAALEPTGDAEARIASGQPAEPAEPAETAEVPPASDMRSTAIAVEPQPAPTSVPGKPRRRPLPRRG